MCDRLVKLAKPLTAVVVIGPCSVPAPLLRVAVTTVLLSELIKLPNESSMRSTGCWTNTKPAVAVLEGCVWIVRRLAAALLTANELLTALVKLVLLAVSCLVPVTSILRLVNMAAPLPA